MMQLRHLSPGNRFQLRRTGHKYLLLEAQISGHRLFVLRDGEDTPSDLNAQCHIKPIVRCDGEYNVVMQMIGINKSLRVAING